MRESCENNSASAFVLLGLVLFVGMIACFGGLEGRSSITAYDDEIVDAVAHNH